MFKEIVVVKSGGDLGSAVAHRLVQSGFSVIITEREQPLSIRRRVSFSEAIYRGEALVEGLRGIKAEKEAPCRILELLKQGSIPVVVDEDLEILQRLAVAVVVDATLRKENVDMHRGLAPMTIALGPGFTAPTEVDAVIETNRGHDLGRIYYRGQAMEDTGIPGAIEGRREERVIYSPATGVFYGEKDIGELVKAGDLLGYILGGLEAFRNIGEEKKGHPGEKTPVSTPLEGMIRGLIRRGTVVKKGMKIGDVDPRGKRASCDRISDKGRTISGGVLEAILHLRNKKQRKDG